VRGDGRRARFDDIAIFNCIGYDRLTGSNGNTVRAAGKRNDPHRPRPCHVVRRRDLLCERSHSR
jgi:hypothetical protein